MGTTATSFCRLCPALCGVRVTVDDSGAVTRILGDTDHPLSRGYMCPKGRRMATLGADPQRLDRPMMRTPDGRLAPVDWDTALDDLAARLTEVRARHDDYAVANYSGTVLDAGGRWVAQRLMAAIGSPSRYTSSTIDSVAKVLVGKLMSGREGLVPAIDFDTTTLLVVVGENMVVSHGGFSYFTDPVRSLKRIARRGELWVLDPRRTETARLATRHLAPRSGTDFAVLAHLIRELLHDGADVEHLARHARRVEELRRAVEPFDAVTTAERTGVAAADLAALLASVRRHRRLAIVTGTGVTMAATANVTEWMAYALQVVTGSFERPGGRWFNHTATFDPTATMPDTSGFGPGPRSHPELPRMAGQYPCAVLADEIEQQHVRALLVTGGNPLTAFPEPDRLARDLDALDVLAVWDIVDSVTARRATHVFPAPDPLERADLVTPVHLSMVYAHYTPPVVPLRAQRRPMWWSIGSLAHRMGLSILPDGVHPDACTDDDVFAAMVAGTPVDWERLRGGGGAAVEFPRHDRWVERTVLPDGRWDVAPALLVERMDHAMSLPQPPLVLGNRRQVHHTNSTLAWQVERPPVYVNPHDAAECGVGEGDAAVVRTAYGEVVATVRLEPDRAPGSVAIPHGFSEPNVARLTSVQVDVDPLTGMPTLVGVAVTLEPHVSDRSPC